MLKYIKNKKKANLEMKYNDIKSKHLDLYSFCNNKGIKLNDSEVNLNFDKLNSYYIKNDSLNQILPNLNSKRQFDNIVCKNQKIVFDSLKCIGIKIIASCGTS